MSALGRTAVPERQLRHAVQRVEHRVSPDDGIVTAYNDGVVTLRTNRRADGYHQSMNNDGYKGVRRGDLVIHGLDLVHGSVGVSDSDGQITPVSWVTRPVADMDARFIAYALRTIAKSGFVRANAKGVRSAGADYRRWETLAEIPVPAPSLTAQVRVSDFLDRECERIAAAAAAVRTQATHAEALRAALAREAAAALRCRPLKHVATVLDCKHRTADYVSDGYPLISTREVTRGSLVVDEATRRVARDDFDDLRDGGRDPRRGDIIYSRNASVGIAAYVADDTDVCLGQDVVLITRRPRGCELLSVILNWGVADQVSRMSVGSTFSRINVAVLRELVVPDDEPGREGLVLDRLRADFAALDHLHNVADQLVDRLTEYRAAVITEAVTGQMDVTRLSEAQMDERLHEVAETAPSTLRNK